MRKLIQTAFIGLAWGTEIFAADFEGKCRVANLFESSSFLVKDVGGEFTFTYGDTNYALHYPDTTKPIKEMGLLKDGERIQFLRVKFNTTKMSVHSTDPNIREVHSGNTVLEVGVTASKVGQEPVVEIRPIDLHWASLYISHEVQTFSTTERRQHIGLFVLRTKTSHEVEIRRELECGN